MWLERVGSRRIWWIYALCVFGTQTQLRSLWDPEEQTQARVTYTAAEAFFSFSPAPEQLSIATSTTMGYPNASPIKPWVTPTLLLLQARMEACILFAHIFLNIPTNHVQQYL